MGERGVGERALNARERAYHGMNDNGFIRADFARLETQT
jgi:hypothetical protein